MVHLYGFLAFPPTSLWDLLRRFLGRPACRTYATRENISIHPSTHTPTLPCCIREESQSDGDTQIDVESTSIMNTSMILSQRDAASSGY
ncbi:uncharacterized protein PHALS_00668 [Plasmopara halstedii]|uniref:Uncharacterized protein n=1 Tax=Plasmopara halstedii TaxID=4781 RepID=A0A0N7L6H6_PLAHL|nr:uncharacterized protein PHALS_00668 [Plasmopara halstedii]CEG44299.1 hypothetical protein PHALS_00668 [Plasmopara halstedii]|eukprot:XP_024580668.1 hypothetical protein PHALS_00668 [Plasmopara halstedii]